MKQLKVGIIGQGRSGRDIHAAGLAKMPEMYKIVAITDALEDRRKRAADELGCNVYADYKEMIKNEELDFVINSSFSYMHPAITLDLLKSGCNVVCEKPFAHSAAEADEMIETAQKTGKQLFVFQQSRFAPYFRKVREIIDSGVIGRPVQISVHFNGFARRWDWQTLQEYYGGNLLNTGPHPLDQALCLFGGQDMPKVTCIMDRTNTFGNAEDYVKLLMTGKDHPVIDLEISSCCAYPSFTYNVQGTRGGIKGTMNHVDWKYYKEEEAPAQKLTAEPLKKEDGTPAYCGEPLVWHEEAWDVPKEQNVLFNVIAGRYYTNLYETIVNGAPFEIELWQVRRQIAVIEECHRQNPLSK